MRLNRVGRVGIRNAAVVGALALLPFAAVGCAEDTTDEDTATVAEDDAQHEYFGSDQFVGDDVVVSAVVTDVLGDKAFVLDGSEYGDESLLVLSADLDGVRVGDVVRLTGIVGEFVHADYREEYGLFDEGVYDLFVDEEFLLAQSVQAGGGDSSDPPTSSN